MQLDRALKAVKCTMAPQAFQSLIVKTYKEKFRELPDEQMVRDLDRARDFCDLVRARSQSPELTDVVIIGTVQNLRKRSKLKKAQAKANRSLPGSVHVAGDPMTIKRPKGSTRLAPSPGVCSFAGARS